MHGADSCRQLYVSSRCSHGHLLLSERTQSDLHPLYINLNGSAADRNHVFRSEPHISQAHITDKQSGYY